MGRGCGSRRALLAAAGIVDPEALGACNVRLAVARAAPSLFFAPLLNAAVVANPKATSAGPTTHQRRYQGGLSGSPHLRLWERSRRCIDALAINSAMTAINSQTIHVPTGVGEPIQTVRCGLSCVPRPWVAR
jgi:hypothetical protein